ncbi:type II CRISPR RNA-guided endonuclease Cas9 [Secundilactobacillus paracollinoides]|uniref:type II CRISPR RNA-guided endonuclease Cas9 n=1 Tax=Secundilactobacillus paracollinoides TaxID=240427 RepID=UPI003F45162D
MGVLLSLNIDIAAVGYAVLQTDERGKPERILKLNTVQFTPAENPKDGASLALPARQRRHARRCNRRTKFRKQRVRQLFLKYGLLTTADMTAYFNQQLQPADIWQLRVQGLDGELTSRELFAVLYYLAGHRGFRSNARSETTGQSPAELGRLLQSIQATKQVFQAGHYRTFGEMLVRDPRYRACKHNKDYQADYLVHPLREWIVSEARLIINHQRQSDPRLSRAFQKDYIALLKSQRDFDTGPSAPSRFGGNLIEKMVGNDPLNACEKRAAKAKRTYCEFKLMKTVNDIQLVGGDYRGLTALDVSQRHCLLALARQQQRLDFYQARQALNLPAEVRFNQVAYQDEPVKKAEKHTVIVDFKAINEIQTALGSSLYADDTDLIDRVGTILTNYSSDQSKQQALEELDVLSDEEITRLAALNYTSYSQYSLKTMRQLWPFLWRGRSFAVSLETAGYGLNDQRLDRVALYDQLTNPVAKRAVVMALKVVKAVQAAYGHLDALRFSVAPAMTLPFQKRVDANKRQQQTVKAHEKLVATLNQLGIPANGENILKHQLFTEQQGIDPYTGQPIDPERLFNDAYYQIDHIIPYSASFDDRYCNKVVTATANNQQKGNQLPLAFLHSEHHQRFIAWVTDTITSYRKRQHLLKTEITARDQSRWRTRHLGDDRQFSQLLSRYFTQNLRFRAGYQEPVAAVSYPATARLLQRFSVPLPSESTLRYAAQAVVTGCFTPAYIDLLATYSTAWEISHNEALWSAFSQLTDSDGQLNPSYLQVKNQVPLPWPDFRAELTGRLSDDPATTMIQRSWHTYQHREITQLKPVFAIRAPHHSIGGEVHKETVFSPKHYDQTGEVTQRVAISSLKLAKNGDQITGAKGIYALAPDGSNQVVYTAVKVALTANGGSGKQAFPENQLVISTGSQDMVVTKVKVTKKATLLTPVHQGRGVASNSHMVRVDIYRNAKGYAGVPLYPADFKQAALPNRVITARKPHDQWQLVTANDAFICALYPDDSVHIERQHPIRLKYPDGHTDEVTSLDCYFGKINISNNSVTFKAHDGSYVIQEVALSSLDTLQLYQQDYLGNRHLVRSKRRADKTSAMVKTR